MRASHIRPTVKIRASALPSWGDCARRTAAKSFPREIEARGFALRRTSPTVGAAAGTATHHALAAALRAKLANPSISPDDLRGLVVPLSRDAVDVFLLEIGAGVTWDDVTPNSLAAQQQIVRMTRAGLSLVDDLEPRLVEAPLEASIGDGWDLTGSLDLLTADGRLEDFKTGALVRPYQAQLGAYSLLAKAAGYEVRSTAIAFIPRSPVSKPQKPPRRTEYDVDVAERHAWATAQRAKREMTAFLESGDPEALPANPMTMMCGARFCPAHGTSFCRLVEPAPAESPQAQWSSTNGED